MSTHWLDGDEEPTDVERLRWSIDLAPFARTELLKPGELVTVMLPDEGAVTLRVVSVDYQGGYWTGERT